MAIRQVVSGKSSNDVTLSREEVAELDASRFEVITTQRVKDERDRRAAQPFIFSGKKFQARTEDQKRINGAGTLALAAIIEGAKPGDYRWHGGEADFAWIAADNELVPMDAQTVMAFGQAAARWESAHVFAARALKNMVPIPADFRDDKYWPRSQ